MNKIKRSFFLAAALAGAAFTPVIPALAQNGALSTNAPIPTPQSFLTTAERYFTTFNTNLNTFSTNSPYQVWAGAEYQAGLNLGGIVGAEGNPFSKAPGLTLRSVSTLASQVGTLTDEEVDIGWAVTHYDTRFEAFVGGDWDILDKTGRAVVGAEVEKAITQNTFAGLFIEGKFGGGKTGQPVLGFFTGFTF